MFCKNLEISHFQRKIRKNIGINFLLQFAGSTCPPYVGSQLSSAVLLMSEWIPMPYVPLLPLCRTERARRRRGPWASRQQRLASGERHCIEHGTLLYRGRNLRQKVYILCPFWAYSLRHTRSGPLIWAQVPQNLAGDVSASVTSRSLTVFHRYLVLAVQCVVRLVGDA